MSASEVINIFLPELTNILFDGDALIPIIKKSFRFLRLGFFFRNNTLLSFFLLINPNPDSSKRNLSSRVGFELQLKPFCLFDIRSLLQADLSVRHNNNRRLPSDRTPLFTKSTTVALGSNDDRTSKALHGTENNGVVRTDFIADQAEFILSPDQAHFFPQNGCAHLSVRFFLKRNRPDRCVGQTFPQTLQF